MTVIVSDSFNRANSTTSLGTTDSYNGGTAKTWTAVQGTWGINGNQAYPVTATNDGFAVVDAAQANVKLTVTSAADTANTNGIYFRYVDVNNYWRFIKGIGQVYLQKRVSGSNTTVLNPTGLTFANGDILSLTANGSAIEIFLNGVSKGSVTDTTHQTATKHGIGMQATNNTDSRFDNFQIEDFATGGTNASVTVPVATATNSALAPIVTGQASITAVTANVTISGVAPSISAGVNITSIAASAAASANAPSVGSATNVTINGIAATVNAEAIAPSVTTDVTVSSVTANTNAAAVAPVITASQPNVSISAVTASSTSAANAPSISADANITATATNVTVSAGVPAVTSTKNVEISATVATALNSAIAPVITTIRNVNVIQSVAAAVAVALNPTISLNSTEIVGRVTLQGKRVLIVNLNGSRELNVMLRGDLK